MLTSIRFQSPMQQRSPSSNACGLLSAFGSQPSFSDLKPHESSSQTWQTLVLMSELQADEGLRRSEITYARFDAPHKILPAPWMRMQWSVDVGWHRTLTEIVSDQAQSPHLLPQSPTLQLQPHRHLKQLLAEAAHDVRAPIAVAQQILASVVDRIRSGADLTSADQGMLAEASHRLTQAQNWAEGILTERRLEHGQPANIRRRFYPHQWLIEQQPALNSLAAQHRVQLVWKGWDRSLPRLYLDPTHLSRVVLNLVTNAIRASQPESRVEIQVAWLTNITQHLQITVTDTGCGLPGELLRQVNANQLWPTNTAGADAGGMGLRTVKALARAMGGALSAHAIPTGGTQFCLSLPVDNYHSLIRGWIRQNIDLTPMQQRHWPHHIAIYALRGSLPTPVNASSSIESRNAQLDTQLQRAASVKDLVYRVAQDRWLWLSMAARGPSDLGALESQPASLHSTPASLSKVLRAVQQQSQASKGAALSCRHQRVYRMDNVALGDGLTSTSSQQNLASITSMLAEKIAELIGDAMPPIDLLSSAALGAVKPIAGAKPDIRLRIDDAQGLLPSANKTASRGKGGALAETPAEAFSGTLAELSKQWQATHQHWARTHAVIVEPRPPQPKHTILGLATQAR